MELRHLRYFIAVAEEGSLKVAAEKTLHTSQPSLSRQIRDLERQVGVQLMSRSVRGIKLTAAGRVFLDQARLVLAQADAAAEAARRMAHPIKPIFALGFLVGHEVDCIPAATSILRDELSNVELRIFSGFSTTLADDLQHGRLDLAFLRPEPGPDLEYRVVAKEPLVAILPADHPLALDEAFDPHALASETFIGISPVPRVLRRAVNEYLKRSGIDLVPHLEIDNFAMAISLVESERGVALLPASIEDFLPRSIVSRRLKGEQPTIDLVIGYRRANNSPLLKRFLSRFGDLTALIDRRVRPTAECAIKSSVANHHSAGRGHA